LGKVVDMLNAKGMLSPSGNPKWTKTAVDKFLSNGAMWITIRLDIPEKQPDNNLFLLK